MRAMRIHELTGIDALRLEDVPSPKPGPGELHVAVHAAGVNFADTLVVKGQYQHKAALPFTPGMEAAGEVLAVGDGVTDFAPAPMPRKPCSTRGMRCVCPKAWTMPPVRPSPSPTAPAIWR